MIFGRFKKTGYLFAIVAAIFWQPFVATAQLDETWTLSIGGQTVQANEDGSFQIANIPVSDNFGSDGSNSPPDSVSDDFLKLNGVSSAGGITRYVSSGEFQPEVEGQNPLEDLIDELVFSSEPAPLFASLRITVDRTNFDRAGQTAQIQVVATRPDGSSQDVTSSAQSTIYRSSNNSIATVDADGLVTIVGGGNAIITAINGSIATTQTINVSFRTGQTIVEGRIVDELGQPIPGLVIYQSGGNWTSTDSEGRFSSGAQLYGGGFIFAVIYRQLFDPTAEHGIFDFPAVVDGFTDMGTIVFNPQDNSMRAF